MNPSISRLLITLPLSIVLSLGLVLLTWSINEVPGNNNLFNFGIIYVMSMMSFMAIISIRKIIAAENSDYTQSQLDLMLEAAVMSPKTVSTVVTNQNINEDIDFDYSKTPPHQIPSPEVDKSLRF